MTKRWSRCLLLLIVVVVAGALAAGCGDEAAQNGGGEVINLKYSDQNPVTGWSGSQAAAPWLAQVEEATGSRVKIEPFWAETLFPGKDAWESVKAGVSDMAWCFHGYWRGMTSLSDVIALPFLPIKSAEETSAVLWQLYEEFPAIREQYQDVHVVTLWTSSPYYLLTVDKKVETLADFAGLKIRAVGGPPTDAVKAMGATPVSVPMPETYHALQTGVIDGILVNWEAMYTFKHYELCKYLTMVPLHVVYFSQAFNKAKWDTLPADIQTAIMSVGGVEGARHWGRNMFDTAAEAVDELIKQEGYELTRVELAPEELNSWKEQFGEPLWEAWVAAREAEGHTEARDILNRTLELLE